MKQAGSLRGSIVIATILYVLDALVLNQGFITGATALLVILFLLPKALLAAFKHERELVKTRALKLTIYTIMVLGVFVTNYLNDQLARHRADALISACRQYEAKYQHLPATLQQLVPEFIPTVPLAKYTLSSFSNRFRYTSCRGKHSLHYADASPFGRPTYYFEEGRWGYMD